MLQNQCAKVKELPDQDQNWIEDHSALTLFLFIKFSFGGGRGGEGGGRFPLSAGSRTTTSGSVQLCVVPIFQLFARLRGTMPANEEFDCGASNDVGRNSIIKLSILVSFLDLPTSWERTNLLSPSCRKSEQKPNRRREQAWKFSLAGVPMWDLKLFLSLFLFLFLFSQIS